MFDYNEAVKVVTDYLAENHPGKLYSVRPGNGCVWVSMGRTEGYYFVRDGKVVDVIYD